jgi:epoxyqueuosine reductase
MSTQRKENYQKTLEKILDKLCSENRKPSLLLHACCAPCSSYVLEYISYFFKITIYYYNPNIFPEKEYLRRLGELQNFLPKFAPAQINQVKLITTDYNIKDYFNATKVQEEPELQKEKERGERCRRCYLFRMQKAYEYARTNNFEWFTTTLSISPFKDAEKINTIGKSLEQQNGPRFLTSDFKKHNGFLRSLQLSREYGLYRQNYCGCIYSSENKSLPD